MTETLPEAEAALTEAERGVVSREVHSMPSEPRGVPWNKATADGVYLGEAHLRHAVPDTPSPGDYMVLPGDDVGGARSPMSTRSSVSFLMSSEMGRAAPVVPSRFATESSNQLLYAWSQIHCVHL